MAKNIRWQIPFVSLQGIHYRVDIYDEGEFTPVQLTAGPTPFVTNEDASDDFFHPVRTQTGTLQVCTLKPDGTYITLDELLPSNNIARPVLLINTDNSDSIEWQGFLSCEAYSQDYTGIPQNIDLPVISVMEAMDSVEVELSESMAFQRILSHCIYAMKAIETKSGMSLFNTIYLDGHCQYETIANYFYNNVYFKTEEQISGDNIVVEVHSISCKSILEQVAKFFGCCWREIGQNIYFEAVGRTTYYAYDTFSNIYNSLIAGTSTLNLQNINASTANLASSEWMGTGHQRTVMQGMRRVKVSAKLSEFDCDMKLEECPVNSLVENPSARQSNWGEVHVNTNETFYNLAEHKHYFAKAVFPTDLSGAHLDYKYALSGINYAHTSFWETSLFQEKYYELVVTQSLGSNSGLDCYLTSFMMYLRDSEDDELKSCLAICGVPQKLIWDAGNAQGRVWTKYALTATNYIFKQRTPLIFAATSGYLNIDIETLAWVGTNMINPAYISTNVGTGGPAITIAVQFGSKWLYQNGTTYEWSDEFHTINYKFAPGNNTKFGKFKSAGNWSSDMPIDEVGGLLVEIPELMIGFVSVYVYHEINAFTDQPSPAAGIFDVVLSKLDVSYIPLPEELRTDRSENTYAAETSQAFRDELALGVDLASYANNTKLATMVWESDGVTPVKLMTLDGASVRPEVNLLNRLASFYGAARQRLELEVAHPTAAPLPLLKLNGINDGKVYLPLSESRDWQTDVCKLTCFETPQ